ncbi:MAG: hypothetical protein HYR96_02480 [Deltaproteobacteria bacterium]|nr:hypothetical protein [Deltaproteobacteria bacterium]MBI3295885.1 hypothetical protein [Deltaproteobacteria bacterium]
MSRRLQIPVSASDEDLFKVAARQAGLSTAEWARRLLSEKALESIRGNRSPKEALEMLFSLQAPVADIRVMVQQSFKGRYK